MEIIRFIFADAFHFVGCAFLLWLTLDGIKDIVKALRGTP